MDKTISIHATYTGFLLVTARRMAPWRLIFAPLIPFVMLAYVAKIISRERLKEINFKLLLGQPTPAQLEAPLNAFADDFMASNLRQGAVAQIAQDRKNGYRIVMATASFHLYVDHIAARLGIDDVIATKLAHAPDGRVLAQIVDGNCYAQNKRVLIHKWLADQGLEAQSCQFKCYSDHVSDQYMLELSDHPIAANASPKLRIMAQQRGWEMVEWS